MLLFLAVALVSAGALAYEVLLTRLFSIVQWHHYAYMVISIALLGYGASGAFLALVGDGLRRHLGAAFAAGAALFAVCAAVLRRGHLHRACTRRIPGAGRSNLPLRPDRRRRRRHRPDAGAIRAL